MSLDHGILNVPLHKRGNIDAELDRYKAQQAADAREKAQAVRAQTEINRQRAKAMVAALSDERLQEIAKPHRLTAKQARTRLMSDAHWQPALIIRALSKEAT